MKETPIRTKPTGYVPIERTGVDAKGRASKHFHGDPAYQIERPDAEALRKAEMTVGDDGKRTTRMTKLGPTADEIALQQYRNNGYEIKDGGHEWILTIDQARFEEIERVLHQRARQMSESSKKSSGAESIRKTEAFEDEEGEVSNRDI